MKVKGLPPKIGFREAPSGWAVADPPPAFLSLKKKITKILRLSAWPLPLTLEAASCEGYRYQQPIPTLSSNHPIKMSESKPHSVIHAENYVADSSNGGTKEKKKVRYWNWFSSDISMTPSFTRHEIYWWCILGASERILPVCGGYIIFKLTIPFISCKYKGGDHLKNPSPSNSAGRQWEYRWSGNG